MLELLTHRDFHPEVQFWVALAVGAGLLSLAAVSRWKRRSPEEVLAGRGRMFVRGVLLVLVVATGVSYFYGSRKPGVWTHNWDLFHTSMSTRYFDELGYFKLYECSFVLGRDAGLLHHVKKFRDPRDHEVVVAEPYLETSDCRERFTPERRDAFVEDLRFFASQGLSHKLFTDKGYNGTPAYSMLAGAFLRGDLSKEKLGRLGLVDVALVVVALLFLWRAFGIDVALLAALFFFVSFPGRFLHMGGSILRFDYVACTLAALGALRLGRHGLAGGLIAYAAMVRAFPVLFAVGYGVYAAWDIWKTRRIARRHIWFLSAFAAVCAGLFATSSLVYGLDSWMSWYENLRAHTHGTAAFRIGLRHFFMIEPPWAEGAFSLSGPTAETYAAYRWLHLATAALLLLPIAWAARNASPAATTGLFGLFAFYAVMVATRYYYAIFAVVVLLDVDIHRRRLDLALLATPFLLMAGTNRYYESGDGWGHVALTYNFVFSGLAGLVLLLFIAHQLWRARRAERPRHANAA